MAQVSVTIDGRKYRLACNEGEERRLEQIAGLVDAKIGDLRRAFGEIGDQRLIVMAALTFADKSFEAREVERSRARARPRRGAAGRRGRSHSRRAWGAARGARGPAGGRARDVSAARRATGRARALRLAARPPGGDPVPNCDARRRKSGWARAPSRNRSAGRFDFFIQNNILRISRNDNALNFIGLKAA